MYCEYCDKAAAGRCRLGWVGEPSYATTCGEWPCPAVDVPLAAPAVEQCAREDGPWIVKNDVGPNLVPHSRPACDTYYLPGVDGQPCEDDTVRAELRPYPAPDCLYADRDLLGRDRCAP